MSFTSSQGARRTAAVFSILVSAVLAAALFTAQPASAAKVKRVNAAWAPAATATIHPGVQAYTEGAQCTANFVFTDGAGNTYVGYAAHCAGTGEATDTNGCDAASLPLGTKVDFAEGGSLVSEGTRVGGGTLAYSSWLTMQANGESDENTCAYNDLALVKVDAADVSKVNPSIPFWGGPVGINSAGTAAGDTVYSFGNSSLRGGITQLSPKQGLSLGTEARGLEPPGLHRVPGRPRRLGQRLPRRRGQRAGRPVHPRPRAARRLERRGRPEQRAQLRQGQQRHRRPGPGARHRAVRADPLRNNST